MPSTKFNQYLQQVRAFAKSICKNKLLPQILHTVNFFGSSWRIIAFIFCGIIFLYYPLGALIINNIDTDTSVDISDSETNRSATIETISYLIRKEVNDKIWTPNLPFFFPSYLLDNMPEFQLGLINGIGNFTSSISSRWEQKVGTQEERLLTQASQLLQYPPHIWMFSSENKLMPAPSAPSQYRKARKLLIKYNQELNNEKIILYKTPQDLIFFLKNISNSLHKVATKLENHIREESSDYIDNQADNMLYRAKGIAYAYYMLLKALAVDYKNILIDTETYPEWTRMLKALENAAQLNPILVRNGEINSSLAPNHLSTEGFYLLKARSIMQNISYQLEKYSHNKE